MTIYGGPGDDIFKQGAESRATNEAGTRNLSTDTYLIGDAGNDKFEEFVGIEANSLNIYGGEGNDKISGGSGFGTVIIDATEGDDVVYGID